MTFFTKRIKNILGILVSLQFTDVSFRVAKIVLQIRCTHFVWTLQICINDYSNSDCSCLAGVMIGPVSWGLRFMVRLSVFTWTLTLD